jgi:small subunit ribosomal protein S16
LGHYDPRNKELKLNREKINNWINLGAQPSKTVLNLLNKN